jgi:hypothetical protein
MSTGLVPNYVFGSIKNESFYIGGYANVVLPNANGVNTTYLLHVILTSYTDSPVFTPRFADITTAIKFRFTHVSSNTYQIYRADNKEYLSLELDSLTFKTTPTNIILETGNGLFSQPNFILPTSNLYAGIVYNIESLCQYNMFWSTTESNSLFSIGTSSYKFSSVLSQTSSLFSMSPLSNISLFFIPSQYYVSMVSSVEPIIRSGLDGHIDWIMNPNRVCNTINFDNNCGSTDKTSIHLSYIGNYCTNTDMCGTCLGNCLLPSENCQFNSQFKFMSNSLILPYVCSTKIKNISDVQLSRPTGSIKIKKPVISADTTIVNKVQNNQIYKTGIFYIVIIIAIICSAIFYMVRDEQRWLSYIPGQET